MCPVFYFFLLYPSRMQSPGEGNFTVSFTAISLKTGDNKWIDNWWTYGLLFCVLQSLKSRSKNVLSLFDDSQGGFLPILRHLETKGITFHGLPVPITCKYVFVHLLTSGNLHFRWMPCWETTNTIKYLTELRQSLNTTFAFILCLTQFHFRDNPKSYFWGGVCDS